MMYCPFHNHEYASKTTLCPLCLGCKHLWEYNDEMGIMYCKKCLGNKIFDNFTFKKYEGKFKTKTNPVY
jgi:hypothetical protein